MFADCRFGSSDIICWRFFVGFAMLQEPHGSAICRSEDPDRVDSAAAVAQGRSGYLSHAAAAALPFILAILLYWPTIHCGFLLDDFFHLKYLQDAAAGNLAALLKEFTGNWTGATDGLTSYRPAISVSLWFDYMAFGANPAGYHLTNLVMFGLCCSCLYFICIELGTILSLRRSRLFALAAALLFAGYPLHPESVAWIIGRVDVQCTLFYLLSLYFYLRFLRLANKATLAASLVAFAAALPSKEMAASLPVIVSLADILLSRCAAGKQMPWTRRVMRLGGFWILLAVFALWRTAVLGTVVGGYGHSSLKLLLASLRNFMDKDSLLKAICGVNEEMHAGLQIQWAGIWLFAAAAALTAVTCWYQRRCALLTGFCVLWLVIALLPTFQIWHIYPNLVGSRLFFLSSAPLCIFLAAPLAEWSNGAWPLKQSRFAAALCGGVLLGLLACWMSLLTVNLKPWVIAGEQMRTLRQQVLAAAAVTPPGERTLFVDLPRDFAGAGLLGRPEFLSAIVSPPLSAADYSGRVFSAECPLPGAADIIYACRLGALLADPAVYRAWRWDYQQGQYVPWSHCPGEGRIEFPCVKSNFAAVTIEPANSQVQVFSDHLRVNASHGAVTLWMPCGAVDSTQVKALYAKIKAEGRTAGRGDNDIKLVWKSQRVESWRHTEIGGTRISSDKFVFVPGEDKLWTLGGTVNRLGLSILPGAGTIDIYGFGSQPQEEIFPRFLVSTSEGSPQDVYDTWQLRLDTSQAAAIKYDASRVPNAAKALIFATRSGAPLAGVASQTLPDQRAALFTITVNSASGSIPLPAKITRSPGLYQISMLALAADGQPAGLVCEPFTVLVRGR